MSFSSDVKEELSRLSDHEAHCETAELSAAIRLCGQIARDGGHIRLHTENAAVARRFYTLMKNVCRVHPEVSSGQHDYLKKNRVYYVDVADPGDARKVLKAVGCVDNLGRLYGDGEAEFLPDSLMLQRTCCRRAFIRGAFLASGSVTDPEKNYHFEIACTAPANAELLRDLFSSFGLEAKIVLRKKYYVVYLKEGAMISDVLNVMEAHVSMMNFENTRIVKDVRNSVNRRVNCETANIGKTVSAARKQIEDIEYIKNTVGLSRLPENLRDVAAARLAERDATLKELGEALDPPIGKSGVNHRLRKLSRIAQNIRETGHI